MPIVNLKDEEQHLIDNLSYLKRQIADAEKRKGEIDALITLRYQQEESMIQEKWAVVLKMENEVKAINLDTKMFADKFSKSLSSARIQQLMEDKRLSEKESRLAKFQRELLDSAKQAIGNVERTEDLKRASENINMAIQKDFKDLEDRRAEVELRIETLTMQQADAFNLQKDLEAKQKAIAEQDQTSRMSVMKSLSEELRIKGMEKDLEKKRQEVLSLQKGMDAQMEQANMLVARCQEESRNISIAREEIKGLRQTLMERMVSLDKREAILKSKGG